MNNNGCESIFSVWIIMKCTYYFILCVLLSGCNSVFQPNTKEMRSLLKEYDNYFIQKYDSDLREETRQEDELFRDIGLVTANDGISYRTVYYIFSWNTSAVEGARHETRKILVYKNDEYIKEYYLNIYPIKITIENRSQILMINEDGRESFLDFTDGLPSQISVP